jgi:hypothetical protein
MAAASVPEPRVDATQPPAPQAASEPATSPHQPEAPSSAPAPTTTPLHAALRDPFVAPLPSTTVRTTPVDLRDPFVPVRAPQRPVHAPDLRDPFALPTSPPPPCVVERDGVPVQRPKSLQSRPRCPRSDAPLRNPFVQPVAIPRSAGRAV